MLAHQLAAQHFPVLGHDFDQPIHILGMIPHEMRQRLNLAFEPIESPQHLLGPCDHPSISRCSRRFLWDALWHLALLDERWRHDCGWASILIMPRCVNLSIYCVSC